jgi:hypothetical protein
LNPRSARTRARALHTPSFGVFEESCLQTTLIVVTLQLHLAMRIGSKSSYGGVHVPPLAFAVLLFSRLSVNHIIKIRQINLFFDRKVELLTPAV